MIRRPVPLHRAHPLRVLPAVGGACVPVALALGAWVLAVLVLA